MVCTAQRRQELTPERAWGRLRAELGGWTHSHRQEGARESGVASSSQKWELVFVSLPLIQGAGRNRDWRVSEQCAHEWTAWLGVGQRLPRHWAIRPGFEDTSPSSSPPPPASLPELGK